MLLSHKHRGFFIKDILSPSFGTIKAEEQESALLNSSKSPEIKCKSGTRFQNSKTCNTEYNSVVRNENMVKIPKENCDTSPHDKKFWPSWVFCTRYSDRPSSGSRSRKEVKKTEKKSDEKRPRTAFTSQQLSRLQQEFSNSKYLTDFKRKTLAGELELKESQIKIWFQNKRAKIKKSKALGSSEQPQDNKCAS